MKLNNKLKLSLIAIATIVATNTNAQTFYSCIPQGCPSGQYFDGVKCLPLPSSGNSCSAGYVWDDSQSACFKETCTYTFTASSVVSADPGVSYNQGSKVYNYCTANGSPYYNYTATMKHGACIVYNKVDFIDSVSPPKCPLTKNYKHCCNDR